MSPKGFPFGAYCVGLSRDSVLLAKTPALADYRHFHAFDMRARFSQLFCIVIICRLSNSSSVEYIIHRSMNKTVLPSNAMLEGAGRTAPMHNSHRGRSRGNSVIDNRAGGQGKQSMRTYENADEFRANVPQKHSQLHQPRKSDLI